MRLAGARSPPRQAGVERVHAAVEVVGEPVRVVGLAVVVVVRLVEHDAGLDAAGAAVLPVDQAGGGVAAELHQVRQVVVVLVVGAVEHAVAVGVGGVDPRAGVADAVGLLHRVAAGPVLRRQAAVGLVVVGEAVGVLVALVVGQLAV